MDRALLWLAAWAASSRSVPSDPSSAGPAPSGSIDRSTPSQDNPALKELHRDPWGRVMVTTPPRIPTFVPASLRSQIERGELPEGLTRFSTHDGRDAVVFHKQSGGFRTYEMMTFLPEDEATHIRAARGDLDAARRLRDASIQWNRDMHHFIDDLGMEPGEARAELRRINEEVFRLVVEAAATMITSAAGVTAVRLPANQVSSPRRTRASDLIPEQVPVRGTAQGPRLTWKPNQGNAARSIDEAKAIAKKHGVDIPEDVKIFVVPDDAPMWKGSMTDAYASYGVRGPTQRAQLGRPNRIELDDLFVSKGDEEYIPIKIRESVLKSDEAIVAVLAHEMHEISSLKALFDEVATISTERFFRLVGPGFPGNLHDKAWDVADALVKKLRGET